MQPADACKCALQPIRCGCGNPTEVAVAGVCLRHARAHIHIRTRTHPSISCGTYYAAQRHALMMPAVRAGSQAGGAALAATAPRSPASLVHLAEAAGSGGSSARACFAVLCLGPVWMWLSTQLGSAAGSCGCSAQHAVTFLCCVVPTTLPYLSCVPHDSPTVGAERPAAF